jgi:TusA-related sulfurtransferase
VADFAAFCRTTGNELVEQSDEGGVWTYLIRKS